MISIIAAVGREGELGKSGKLLFHIPEDMKFFKETTTGHPVIMGRKTWDSLPGKLSGRKNIVVSREAKLPEADQVVNNLTPFLEICQKAPEEYFVIGGAAIYAIALPFADKVYLTKIDASREADAYFPTIKESDYRIETLGKGEHEGLRYSLVLYTKR